jgi:hypothetical protein
MQYRANHALITVTGSSGLVADSQSNINLSQNASCLLSTTEFEPRQSYARTTFLIERPQRNQRCLNISEKEEARRENWLIERPRLKGCAEHSHRV